MVKTEGGEDKASGRVRGQGMGLGKGKTHPAVHQESWIPAVCLPQTRGNLEHK